MTRCSVVVMAAAAGALLAGCSDDGGTSDGPRPTYEALFAERAEIHSEAFFGNVPHTDAAALPTSGGAAYEGVMTLDLDTAIEEYVPDREMLGELELEVDFGRTTDAVSGSATNFVNYDGEEFDGTLAITGGDLDRVNDAPVGSIEPHFVGDLGGTLTDESGGSYEFNSDVRGNFRGTEPDYAVGSFTGRVVTPEGERAFNGGFVAER